MRNERLDNRILKASLRRLARAPTLDGTLAQECQLLARRMGDVSDMWLERSAFARVQLHRNNGYYDLLMRVCELAFDSLLPDRSGTGLKFHDVVRDERLMAGVFEQFVRSFYRAEQRDFRVGSQQLEWAADLISTNGVGRLPAMRTDIYLEGVDRRMIIDTKYYAEALQLYRGADTFRSSHLYQLFAYLKNDAAARPDTSVAEGMLLYPQVGAELETIYNLDGHRVALRTIDLSSAWQQIHHRLLAILIS